jgi:hypothetical protein
MLEAQEAQDGDVHVVHVDFAGLGVMAELAGVANR